MRALRVEAETMHSFGMEHALDLRAPDGFATICILLNHPIQGIECAGTVVLRPVELYPARNPWTCQTHQCRLDDAVVIDKVIAIGLVKRHLYAPANLRQNHDLQITVFKEE